MGLINSINSTVTNIPDMKCETCGSATDVEKRNIGYIFGCYKMCCMNCYNDIIHKRKIYSETCCGCGSIENVTVSYGDPYCDICYLNKRLGTITCELCGMHKGRILKGGFTAKASCCTSCYLAATSKSSFNVCEHCASTDSVKPFCRNGYPTIKYCWICFERARAQQKCE